MALRFPIWYFFECCSEWIFKSLQLFFHIYQFSFSVIFSLFPYFVPKLFCFLFIWLLLCLCAFSYYLLVEFHSSFWNVLFYLYFFILSQYLFRLPPLTSYFWFISSSWIVCFNHCIDFLFLSQNIPAFFLHLRIFVCCHRFLIIVSSLISHPYSKFLSVFF